MSVVNNNMQVVYNEISALANEFHDFAYQQRLDNRTVQAETRIVKIRQEIDDQFGHYDIVRREFYKLLILESLKRQHCLMQQKN